MSRVSFAQNFTGVVDEFKSALTDNPSNALECLDRHQSLFSDAEEKELANFIVYCAEDWQKTRAAYLKLQATMTTSAHGSKSNTSRMQALGEKQACYHSARSILSKLFEILVDMAGTEAGAQKVMGVLSSPEGEVKLGAVVEDHGHDQEGPQEDGPGDAVPVAAGRDSSTSAAQSGVLPGSLSEPGLDAVDLQAREGSGAEAGTDESATSHRQGPGGNSLALGPLAKIICDEEQYGTEVGGAFRLQYLRLVSHLKKQKVSPTDLGKLLQDPSASPRWSFWPSEQQPRIRPVEALLLLYIISINEFGLLFTCQENSSELPNTGRVTELSNYFFNNIREIFDAIRQLHDGEAEEIYDRISAVPSTQKKDRFPIQVFFGGTAKKYVHGFWLWATLKPYSARAQELRDQLREKMRQASNIRF